MMDNQKSFVQLLLKMLLCGMVAAPKIHLLWAELNCVEYMYIEGATRSDGVK